VIFVNRKNLTIGYRWLNAFVRRHALLLTAVVVPLLICSPLLSSKGLFEFGDANFPLRPFPLDYFLPWQGASDGGVDNVLIGLPRFAYYAGINLAEFATWSLQAAQWLWYSLLLATGVVGGSLLARRLGAGASSIPLGLFWAMNVWSYDRVAQGPIFMAYQAMPLVLLLFIRYLDTGRLYFAGLFALSVFLVTPSLQASYLAITSCLAIAAYFVATRDGRVVVFTRIAIAGIVVALFNAYFLLPLATDLSADPHNSLNLVASNFSDSSFLGYSSHATLVNASKLAAFFYSSLNQEPWLLQLGAWLPLIAVLLVANLRAVRRQRRVLCAVALLMWGLWLVCGMTISQPLYLSLRSVIPGLSLFVEPDYFAPLVVLGYFSILAFGSLAAAQKYKRWWGALVWVMAAVGLALFLPGLRPLGGLPQTPVPQQYVQFARTQEHGRVLWLPIAWVTSYAWSPYTLNGFNALNSPGDYVGPYMLEWVSSPSRRMIDELVSEIGSDQNRAGFGLIQALGVGSIAIAADQTGPDAHFEVSHALKLMRELASQHLASPPLEYRDGTTHLITQRLRNPFPVAGVYSPIAHFRGEYGEFGAAMAALGSAGEYRPLSVASHQSGERSMLTSVGSAKRGIAATLTVSHTYPPNSGRFDNSLTTSTLSAREFRVITDCATGARIGLLTSQGWAIVLRDGLGRWPCTSATIAVSADRVRSIKVSKHFDGVGAVPRVDFVFLGKGHKPTFVSAPDFDASPVPAWATRIQVVLYGAPLHAVKYDNVRLALFSYQNFELYSRGNDRCNGVTNAQSHGLAYSVSLPLGGDCSIVLRASFSPLWGVKVTRGSGTIGNHLEVDGYANGWDVRSDGPLELRIFNRLLAPFLVGVAISAASILLFLMAIAYSRITKNRSDGLAS
jgi:hypothetical protein